MDAKWCLYDNPNTMRRECWEDGQMKASIAFEILYAARKYTLPLSHWHAKVGWSEGQCIGNVNAMKQLEGE